MVTSEAMASMINAQVSRELGNRLLYLHFASWCHNQGLRNLEKFFTGESDGENGHAQKFIDYLKTANAQVAVPAIEEKQSEFKDCDEIAGLYTEAEAATTQHLKDLWAQSVKDNDIGTQDTLQWFLAEQIEEEGLAERFSNIVDLANGSLLILDLMFGD